MVAADLHVHTTNSDGELALAAVPAAARAAGLAAVAVTDHDRLHADLRDPVTATDGLAVIHGIELRVEAGDQRVDLLGYGARRTAELRALVDRVQENRVARGRAMIERVESHLGHEIPVAAERGIGRPDVARAVVASDPDYDDVGAVFDALVGEDGPCYVRREVPDVERGCAVLAGACDLVSLAHPLRYPDPAAALDVALGVGDSPGLDAVEGYYPYDGDREHTGARGSLDPGDVREFAADHGLLVTGGSDAHGRTLGTAGLSREAYRPVARALGITA